MARPIQAEIPESYDLVDSDDDATFYRYDAEDESLTPIPVVDKDYLEIVKVGWTVIRNGALLEMRITMKDTPIVNTSFYYAMSIDLSNETSTITVRVSYSGLGSVGPQYNGTGYSFFYQPKNRPAISEDYASVTRIRDNTIYWIIDTDLVDIISIFDDPAMEMSRVRAELELFDGGSSSFVGGNYYRDFFQQTEFPFSEHPIEGFDPLVLFIYFGIPVLIALIRPLISMVRPD